MVGQENLRTWPCAEPVENGGSASASAEAPRVSDRPSPADLTRSSVPVASIYGGNEHTRCRTDAASGERPNYHMQLPAHLAVGGPNHNHGFDRAGCVHGRLLTDPVSRGPGAARGLDSTGFGHSVRSLDQCRSIVTSPYRWQRAGVLRQGPGHVQYVHDVHQGLRRTLVNETATDVRRHWRAHLDRAAAQLPVAFSRAPDEFAVVSVPLLRDALRRSVPTPLVVAEDGEIGRAHV